MAVSKTTSLGVLVAVWFTPALAFAQREPDTFGARGQVAISAERLLGVYVVKTETEQTGTETGGGGPDTTLTVNNESDTTSFAFLGNNAAPGPAAIPRLAIDFFPIDGLSVGGSILIESNSTETDNLATNSPGPDHQRLEIDSTVFGLSPRVGYAYMFSRSVGIWGRAGVTFLSANVETKTDTIDDDGSIANTQDREDSISHWSFNLEGLLVLSPIPHVAFGVGPFVDIPFANNIETDISDPPEQTRLEGDFSVTSFGVTSALIAWF